MTMNTVFMVIDSSLPSTLRNIAYRVEDSTYRGRTQIYTIKYSIGHYSRLLHLEHRVTTFIDLERILKRIFKSFYLFSVWLKKMKISCFSFIVR